MSILSEAGAVKTPPPADTPAQATNKKRKTRRRIAKGLAWVSVALTVVMVLSEPWLLLPAITLVIALSLWD